MDNLYLEPEFEKPYSFWQKDPTPENTDNLLKAINPVLTAAIRTYGGKGSPTLQSRAKVLALDAIKRYDPTKAKLRTHLMFQLQGLRRYSAKETQILSIPEQIALDLNNLREAENQLRDDLGRDPSDSEISDYTGLTKKRLEYIRKVRPSYSEGFFIRPGDEGEDQFSPAVKQRNNVKQWHEFVYNDLSNIDRVIMEYTFGMHGKPVLANKDIAKKLNLSPGAVSQRKAKIQSLLDLRDEFGVL